jgi:hypothetical protein
MNAYGASKLRQSANSGFNLLRSHRHQIGEFVYDNDNQRQLG